MVIVPVIMNKKESMARLAYKAELETSDPITKEASQDTC
jgi:hypothetical protein